MTANSYESAITIALPLLEQLDRAGVLVNIDGDDLILRPRSRIDDRLVESVQNHIGELIEAAGAWNLVRQLRFEAIELIPTATEVVSRHPKYRIGYKHAINEWHRRDRELRSKHGFTGCVRGFDTSCDVDASVRCGGCISIAAQ